MKKICILWTPVPYHLFYIYILSIDNQNVLWYQSSWMSGMSGSNYSCLYAGRLTHGSKLFKNNENAFPSKFIRFWFWGICCWLSWMFAKSICSTLSLKLALDTFEYLPKLKGIVRDSYSLRRQSFSKKFW